MGPSDNIYGSALNDVEMSLTQNYTTADAFLMGRNKKMRLLLLTADETCSINSRHTAIRVTTMLTRFIFLLKFLKSLHTPESNGGWDILI